MSDMQNTYTSWSPGGGDGGEGRKLEKIPWHSQANHLHLKYYLPYEYPNK